MLSLRGARSATKQSLRPGWPSHFGETNPRSHFGETNPSAASTRRAACSHLILRSRAQRGVSKDGDGLRCSPPFETPAAGGLLRVRSKGKLLFAGTNPRSHFGETNPSAASTRRAACSHLILRSRAQRGVSKDGDGLRCSPPFETPAAGGLLRVRSKGKLLFAGTNPRSHFGETNPSAASTRRAACSHLILRSRAQRGVSKDGDGLRCSPPFETPAAGGLLRVRSKGKLLFAGTNPRSHFGETNPSAASTRRAACSHLILRSRAQRGVSKDGDGLRCSPPFETPAAGGLLRVRSKGKLLFAGTNPRSHFGETNPSAASTRRAACSHLILRSRAQRGVSKDGDGLRCSPPFETPAAGGLLRVRSKGKLLFAGTNPRSHFGETNPSAASTRRAACSHLILRSRAQRGVSKDGDGLRCSPPFETPAAGGLLRVRPRGKSPFGGTNPRSHFGATNPRHVLPKRTRAPR